MFERNALRENSSKIKIQYSSSLLKLIASVMMIIGTIGVAIIQNGVMKLDTYSTATLLEEFDDYGKEFWLATASLICMGIAALALPIYAHLLVEGIKKTSSIKGYAIRLCVLALISELPYDIAMRDSWFTMYSQNPVWGMLIALLMVYFLESFEKIKKFKGLLLKLIIITAAMLWVIMLNVNYGAGMVLVVAVLWLLQGNGALTTFAGVAASIIYFPAPFGFIFNYFYNGEKGSISRKVFYILYPAQLLIIGLIGKYLL